MALAPHSSRLSGGDTPSKGWGKMVRGFCLSICTLLALTAAGCGESTRTAAPVTVTPHYPHHAEPQRGRQAALLFDRIPGEPTATAFNYRSEWPSTDKGYQAAETLYHTTYVNDRQGYGWFHHDYYYRSARSYRTSRIER